MTAAATNQVQTSQAPNTLSAKLRQEAAKSQTFASICHMFAQRERSRHQVMVGSLMAAMKKEGFDFTRFQYIDALKTMANLGLGTLKKSRNNRIQGLIEVKYTLQSIGEAAVAKRDVVEKQVAPNRYTKLPQDPSVKRPPPQDEVERVNLKHPAKLTVDFGKGEISTFDIPNGISAKELGTLLTQFYTK